MPHNNKRAKVKYPHQRTQYEEGRAWFPQGSMEVLMGKLREVHGKLAPSQSTVESVLYGSRPDNFGILPAFTAMVDITKAKMQRAVAELQDAD